MVSPESYPNRSSSPSAVLSSSPKRRKGQRAHLLVVAGVDHHGLGFVDIQTERPILREAQALSPTPARAGKLPPYSKL